MGSVVRKSRWLVAIILIISVVACSGNDELSNAPVTKAPLTNAPTTKNVSVEKISLDVFKSRTCGCCEKWIDHVEAFGLETSVHHPENLEKIKSDKGILPRYQSCHTAVSSDGYVFEGHIPAEIVQRFLANPPLDSIGLAVPGMPMGSPGMEMGSRRDEYDVFLLSKDGSGRIYQHIGANE